MELQYTLRKPKGIEAVNALNQAVRDLVEQTGEDHLKLTGEALKLREQMVRIHEIIGQVKCAIDRIGNDAYYYYEELEVLNNPGFQN